MISLYPPSAIDMIIPAQSKSESIDPKYISKQRVCRTRQPRARRRVDLGYKDRFYLRESKSSLRDRSKSILSTVEDIFIRWLRFEKDTKGGVRIGSWRGQSPSNPSHRVLETFGCQLGLLDRDERGRSRGWRAVFGSTRTPSETTPSSSRQV